MSEWISFGISVVPVMCVCAIFLSACNALPMLLAENCAHEHEIFFYRHSIRFEHGVKPHLQARQLPCRGVQVFIFVEFNREGNWQLPNTDPGTAAFMDNISSTLVMVFFHIERRAQNLFLSHFPQNILCPPFSHPVSYTTIFL